MVGFIILSLFMGMNADDDLVLMTRACMHGMSHFDVRRRFFVDCYSWCVAWVFHLGIRRRGSQSSVSVPVSPCMLRSLGYR